MANDLAKGLKQQANKVILVQLLSVVAVSALCLIGGTKLSLSIFLGGGISILPTWVLAQFGFRDAGARAAKKVVRNFFLGELLKIVLTLVLFVSVIKWAPVEIGYVFLGFAVALVAFWVAPVLQRTTAQQ